METLYSKTKDIIKKYNFNIKKNFGQNFLIDQHVIDKIISSSDITDDDIILEIGPGIGTLTQYLAKAAKKVIAVEIDNSLIPILKGVLSSFDNVEIINNDILKVDIWDIVNTNKDKNIKVVANLPYYITTPIIMKLLEERFPIKSITVMIQKEVAYRMNAKPDSKDYGALSLAVQYYSLPYIVANVPQNCFIPRPSVDSAVIKLNILSSPSINVNDEKLMFKLIKIAFSQRRKTLLNCLYNVGDFNLDKKEIAKLLNESGFDENIRGEKLLLKDFAILSNELEKIIK